MGADMEIRWKDPEEIQNQPILPDIPALVNQILIKRGFSSPGAVQGFLNPDFYRPSSPQNLPGMPAAADRIIRAIHTGEPICIWGDFDVDGQTSTTLLYQCLKALGAKVDYHIPVRKFESHGVNIENLAGIIASGAKVILTCDTGINANAAVDYARERAVDMVITDHHDLPAVLPNAAAILNPKLLAPDNPLATLAGVGVAFKLAEELISRISPSNIEPGDLLDLVALGLVADMAILRGDARYLVQKGLQVLRNSKRAGLRAIYELAELVPANLTEEHIGFSIAPRLNAIGRLGDANPMVELFTTNELSRVRVLATQLEGLNIERKLLCDQVYQAAEAQLASNPELLEQPVIILDHPLWPGGVIGIVASKLVERYHKPAILLTTAPGQPARGSARSIDGVNITEAITTQQNLLTGFGGHPMAAGLSLDPENLPEFRHKLGKTIREMMETSQTEESVLEIDAWTSLAEADLTLASQVEMLAPFGPGNPKITLAARNLTLVSSAKIGKYRDHRRLKVRDEYGFSSQVLWWNGGDTDLPNGKFDLSFSIRTSDWQGTPQAQLEMIDYRLVEYPKIEVKNAAPELIDLRNCEDPAKSLKNLRDSTTTLVWAEGEEKKAIQGKDRTEFEPVKTLIIWTLPPSRQELLNAIEKTKPERILIFGIDPRMDDPQTFLKRLAGLVNFSLKNKDGQTTIEHLAAATAQTNLTIQLGLKWLELKGLFTIIISGDGLVSIKVGAGNNRGEIDSIQSSLSATLEESHAYRLIFLNQRRLEIG